MASFCAEVLCQIDAAPCELSIVFVGPRAMRSLNRTYRGKDYATDVLSFVYEDGNAAGSRLQGDIVIAPAVAFENAHRFGTGAEAEMRKLLVHGILHLLGYDHETDRGEMKRIQSRLMRTTVRTFREAVWRDW